MGGRKLVRPRLFVRPTLGFFLCVNASGTHVSSPLVGPEACEAQTTGTGNSADLGSGGAGSSLLAAP